jgi:ribosome-binding protein aMBF1 (putative translation factor)
MAKSFKTLTEKLPDDSQERIRQNVKQLIEEMPLPEIRKAMAFSQEELADVLNLDQPAISKMERRTDMYLSTLRRFIEAMGGTLDITARFDNRSIHIDQFKSINTLHQG